MYALSLNSKVLPQTPDKVQNDCTMYNRDAIPNNVLFPLGTVHIVLKPGREKLSFFSSHHAYRKKKHAPVVVFVPVIEGKNTTA